MASVNQVVFDPTIFTWGSGAGVSAGCNGYDIWGVYLDKDGSTAWAFENPPFARTSPGTNGAVAFARFRLSDGSILFQGRLFGTGTPGCILQGNSNVDVLFTQDDAGFYYFFYNDQQSPTRTVFLYKAHVAPSASNTIFNGYLTVDSILSVFTGNHSFFSWNYPILPASDGHRYFFGAGGSTADGTTAINVDSMTIVGSYKEPAGFPNYQSPTLAFMDKFGDFWAIVTQFIVAGGATLIKFVKWHPADGASGGNLIVTTNIVNTSPFSFYSNQPGIGSIVGYYNPSTHSISLFSQDTNSSTSSGNAINISLGSFGLNTYVPDSQNLISIPNAFLYSCRQACESGIDNAGQVGIPGYINTTNGQFDGILNIIDGSSFNSKNAINITQLINANPLLVPIGTFSGGFGTQFAGMHGLQYRNGIAVCTFESGGSGAVPPGGGTFGSPVYIVSLGLCGVAQPLGNPFIK